MKIIRYSVAAFAPQEQTYHVQDIYYHLSDGFRIGDYPEFMRWQLQKLHEQKTAFYTEHMDDLRSGIWCFIDGYKDNQSLNHLKRKVPCWEAEVPDDIECYDCNWEKITTISDPCVQWVGCYIPEREMWKIRNIKKRKKIA